MTQMGNYYSAVCSVSITERCYSMDLAKETHLQKPCEKEICGGAYAKSFLLNRWHAPYTPPLPVHSKVKMYIDCAIFLSAIHTKTLSGHKGRTKATKNTF